MAPPGALRPLAACDPEVEHVPVLDDAQAAMLVEVERSGGSTICVAGDFARFARPGLAGLPFEPRLTTEAVVSWRGSTPPLLLAHLVDFTDDWDERVRQS